MQGKELPRALYALEERLLRKYGSRATVHFAYWNHNHKSDTSQHYDICVFPTRARYGGHIGNSDHLFQVSGNSWAHAERLLNAKVRAWLINMRAARTT